MVTKESHPKGYDLYKAYVKGQVIKNTSRPVPDEILDKIITDNMIMSTQKIVNRSFYDFLDEHHIVVTVSQTQSGWKWRVEDTVPMEGMSVTRIQAENDGFIEGFNRLERK